MAILASFGKFACFALIPLLAGGQTVDEIVRRSCERDSDNLEMQQQYTWRESFEFRSLDKKGGVKKDSSKTDEIVWIGGRRYERQIEKDGKPLDSKEDAKEQAKLDKEIQKHRNESEAQLRKRKADREKDLREEREFRAQIPAAYNFQLVAEETVAGRPCWKVQAEPKPGYKGKGRAAGILPKMHGTFWIDKQQYEWVKIDAESLDTVSWGWAVFRVGKGARFQLQQRYVNDEVWFPETLHVALKAKAMLVKGFNIDLSGRFHDYRKFAVESKIQSFGEEPSAVRQ